MNDGVSGYLSHSTCLLYFGLGDADAERVVTDGCVGMGGDLKSCFLGVAKNLTAFDTEAFWEVQKFCA